MTAKRILLCDDEIHITRAAEVKFKRAGYDVCCVTDGLSAWEEIERHAPDFVITDFQMPGLDGGQLCERLRGHEATASLPIVMLTGKGFEMTPDEVQARWGVLELVTKPFSPRALVQTVDQYFAQAETPVATG